MTECDPFAQVFTGLWELALKHPGLNALVVDRNRIRFDLPDRDVQKEAVADADLPELMLLSESISGNLQNTSSSSMITRQYSWVMSTGDFRYNERLSQLEWMLWCAMVGWKDVLTRLTWRGNAFVKRVNLQSSSTGISDPARNRGINGWSAVWRCEVEMHFRTSDLMAEVNVTGSLS